MISKSKKQPHFFSEVFEQNNKLKFYESSHVVKGNYMFFESEWIKYRKKVLTM